jgi:hypothetical protein
MRKRIWIPLVVVLVVCLLLLFLPKQIQSVVSPAQNAMQTNQQSVSQPTPPAKVAATQNPPPEPSSNFMKAIRREMGTNEMRQQLLAEWQAPIEFYGKVIDENSNPVSEANITFKWPEIPAPDGNRTATTESDAEGLFSLHGKRGPSLEVWVGKDGYYASHRGQWGFNYALGPGIISPDPQNPLIFQLHRKGQGVELITSENGMRSDVWVRLPKDNTPVRVDFFQKQASATGQLEISQIKPPFQDATNWSFSLSIPDGGLVENEDEFQFEAPETGYQQTVEYNFIKDDPNWTTQVTKQFYIYFGNPRKYGWLRIESNLAQETIYLTYAINPSGSQNLEPAN